MPLSIAAEAAAITTAATQASKKAFIRILHKFRMAHATLNTSHAGGAHDRRCDSLQAVAAANRRPIGGRQA